MYGYPQVLAVQLSTDAWEKKVKTGTLFMNFILWPHIKPATLCIEEDARKDMQPTLDLRPVYF